MGVLKNMGHNEKHMAMVIKEKKMRRNLEMH
jgi:hypothetical protein